MRVSRLLARALVFVFGLPAIALAGATDPVTVVPAPENLGDIFSPGVRLAADLGYVEEEFFVSGTSTIYTYNDPPVPTEIIPLVGNLPYTTRIIVRRPPGAEAFNGTVVIEWWNSTAGFDTAPVWDPSAEYFTRRGIVYIGVTNSTTSLGFLTGGCALFGILPPACGTRYASLSMFGNAVAYEMVSQIANMLKSDSPQKPLPDDFIVERIYHAGQSQQGGSIVTYATAFHFAANDGYFIQAAGSARPINFGPVCGEAGSPPYPGCTPRLQGDDRRVRTDLPVPVYRAQTETDMAGVLAGDTRQADNELFRYYETAGTAHNTVHKGVEILPPALFPPDGLLLDDTCLFPINSIADGPIFGSLLYNAMWENMEDQVRFGYESPRGDLIETDPNTGAVARDQFGNALGGIRLPDMDVPIATYGPHNTVNPALPPFLQPLLDLFCRLSGTVEPLDVATLDELYPNHGRYVSQYAMATNQLQEDGFLLPEDAAMLKMAAALRPIGMKLCGLGFELVVIVPPLVWMGGRRRRGRSPRSRASSGESENSSGTHASSTFRTQSS